MSSADLLLHPVRLRIVQAFLGQRELTTAELGRLVDDVSPATLYRQVAALVDGGVLDVTAERRVRGASERTYRLRTERASVAEEDLAAMTVEQHRTAFLTFVAGLVADLDRYLERASTRPEGGGRVDLVRDLVGYRQVGFYADEEELQRALDGVRAALAPLLDAEPAPGRTRRLLTTVLLPADPPPPPA